MELTYNLLADILFIFMITGYVVLMAGVIFWLLLLVPRKKTRW